MSDVFISYAREDRAAAERLARGLERQGLSVWWDYNIRFGTQFDEAIQIELTAAKCVLVVWSKSSVASRWVREEAAEALARAALLPVLIEAVDPPIGFKSIQAADLTGWTGSSNHREFRRTLQEIAARLGKRFEKPSAVERVFEWLRNAPAWALAAKWKITAVGLVALLAVVWVAAGGRIFGPAPAGHAEQFAKAVEMLQGQGAEVRVAGINNLGELAGDNQADQRKVLDVLTSYVRQHALLTSDAVLGSSSPCGRTNRGRDIAYVLPEDDIQAVMGVLKNRQWALDPGQNRILLESVCLRKVDLSGASLKHVSFQGSDLKGANLSGSVLEGADLSHADLSRVNLTGANLKGVDLRRAVLTQAQLKGAHFEGANLIASDLRGADLSDVIGLEQKQVDDVALTDNDTRLPQGLHLPDDEE